MNIYKRVLIFIAIIFIPASARAGTFYVDAGAGNDSAVGTSPASAFRTIQRAANVVMAGDSVVVAPG